MTAVPADRKQNSLSEAPPLSTRKSVGRGGVLFGFMVPGIKLGFGAQCALPIAGVLLESDGKVILPVAK